MGKRKKLIEPRSSKLRSDVLTIELLAFETDPAGSSWPLTKRLNLRLFSCSSQFTGGSVQYFGILFLYKAIMATKIQPLGIIRVQSATTPGAHW
jgi:hypothetical protein